ncbi:MAG: radical SAM protein [Planctomycetota bacterium]|nr:MAG: radical SAM protein [Planctomycetota bacterium]
MAGARVFLISANVETVPVPAYPVAIARLAGALERAGHHAEQFDVLVHGIPALAGRVSDYNPDLVAVSLRVIDNVTCDDSKSYVSVYANILDAVRKNSGAPVVLGGSAFSLFPEILMERLGADYGVTGPGEIALCSIADSINRSGKKPDRGEIINGHGESATGGKPEISKSEHDAGLVKFYFEKAGMIGLQAKRGCIFHCSYCTYPLIDGSDLTWYDPSEMAGELEFLKKEHGVDYFFIVDSVFNLDAEKEAAFAEEIIARNLDISWGAFFTPAGISAEYLGLLVKSGLKHVEFGTEAFSDTMLESYCKSFSVADALNATAACIDAGANAAHYLLFGGPGEDERTVRETMENARHLDRCVFFPFAGVRIYPGTGLHRRAVADGVVAPGCDCFDPVFYISPKITTGRIWEIADLYAGGARRWVTPDSYAKMEPVMSRMRARGKKGPLWEYLLY